MTTSAGSAAIDATNVTDMFEANFEAFCSENTAAIQSASALAAQNPDLLEDLHWDAVDELKGSLGASAANGHKKASEQEDAISECESWVANKNLDSVSLILWAYGVEEGVARINEALA